MQLLLMLFALLAAVLCASAQPFAAIVYNLETMLTTTCGGDVPIPDGTPVLIFWDNDSNGPDADDPPPPICGVTPPDSVNDCNRDDLVINGDWILGMPGYFYSEDFFQSCIALPSPPRYFLRVCFNSVQWESNVVTMASGPQEHPTSWTCINQRCSCPPPLPPTDVQATLSPCGRVLVSWTYSHPGTVFDVLRDGVTIADSIEANSYLDTSGVAPFDSASYQVMARCDTTAGSPSQASHVYWDFQPPSDLLASPQACGTVTLSWTVHAAGDSVAIFRDGVLLGTAPGTQNQFVDNTPGRPGTMPSYFLTSRCYPFESPAGPEIQITLPTATLYLDQLDSAAFSVGWIVEHSGSTEEPWHLVSEFGDSGFAAQTSLLGSGVTAAERLLSPLVNLSLVTNASLSFSSQFTTSGNATCFISASPDGGFTWPYLLATYTVAHSQNVSLAVPSALNNLSNVRFRWRFSALVQGAAAWTIDNIQVCGDVPDSLPPTTITNLAVLDSIGTGVRLGWTPAYDANFLSYEVMYDTVPAFGSSTTIIDRISIAALGSMLTSQVTITGVFYGKQNYFGIRARDELAHVSTLSNIVSTRPLPEIVPPQFTVPFPTPGTTWWNTLTGTIGARATDASRLDPNSIRFRVDADGSGSYDPSETWLPAPPNTLLSDSTLRVQAIFAVEGESLHFEFRASDEWGTTGYSGGQDAEGIADDWYVRIDTTRPTPVDSIYFAGYRTETQIQLGWTPSNDLHFQRYELFYATHAGVQETDARWTNTNDGNLSQPSTTLTTISSLARGTRYYFIARAVDMAANKGLFSPEITITTLGAPPRPVQHVVIRCINNDIQLTWRAVREDTLGAPVSVEGYRIYVYPGYAFSPNPEYLLDQTADTTFTVPGAVQYPYDYFFLVTAIGEGTPPAALLELLPEGDELESVLTRIREHNLPQP